MNKAKYNIPKHIFCILALLPILYFILTYVASIGDGENIAISLSQFDDTFGTVYSVIPFLGTLRNWVTNTFFGGTLTIYGSIACNYLSYIFLLECVWLVFYSLLAVFQLIEKLVSNVGGKL